MPVSGRCVDHFEGEIKILLCLATETSRGEVLSREDRKTKPQTFVSLPLASAFRFRACRRIYAAFPKSEGLKALTPPGPATRALQFLSPNP